MGLRIFPVVGEALNFGGRRMATTMRVAWLAVALLLILNMATVFAYLSVIAGRVITFAEMGTYVRAEQTLLRYVERGWTEHFEMMAMITAGNLAMNAILIASFMAPLVRLSGLGEKPAPGVVRLAFGPDQIRYIVSGVFSFLFVAGLILAPVIIGSIYALNYVAEAMAQTMASFPDPESLHTIKLVTVGETLATSSAKWLFHLGIPLAVVAPFAFILWIVAFFHFHPRNRPYAPEGGGPIARAFVALIAVIVLAGGTFLLVREQINKWAMSAAAYGSELIPDLSSAPQNTILFFCVVLYLLALYFNLRLYAYPGVAVCRKSLGLGNTLRVTRGWDLIRLQVVLVFIGLILYILQAFVINFLFIGKILPAVFEGLYRLTIVSTRLVNSGETAEWVRPVFVWTWNGIKILFNVFWIFFSYGVAAGLYGRLYRESERDEKIARRPRQKAVWERNA